MGEVRQDNGMVSIVMLSHGSEDYLRETVESVISQTYQDWELLFVADSNSKVVNSILDLREEEMDRHKESGEAWDVYADLRNKIREQSYYVCNWKSYH